MGDTFGQISRSVRLHVPMAPILLVEDWVQTAFRQAWEYRRPAWSFARVESGFVTNNQKSGLVSVIHGDKFITGLSPLPGGLSFALTDETRQFRAGLNQPLYSIECVDVGTNRAELDRPYLGASSSSIAASVLDAYITFPLDFGRFIVVLDPSTGFPMRHTITEDQLNLWDPQRSSTGTPWALASRRIATLPQLVGRPQYELWPFSTTFHEYWYFYIKRCPELSEDDEFPGLLGSRADLIQTSALAAAAQWPGTEDRKNPYFNMALSKQLSDDYTLELARLEVTDEDIYPSWWQKIKTNEQSFSPLDARFLQSHDFQ